MRTTRDFPISHFLTIRARAECVLRIRIMCTHATRHGQSNARRTVSRYLSLRKTSGRRSGAKRCGVVAPRRGRYSAGRRTNCSAHARLNDHCTISRCERVGRRASTNDAQPTRNIAFPRARIARRFTAAARCYLRRSRFPVHASEIRDFRPATLNKLPFA